MREGGTVQGGVEEDGALPVGGVVKGGDAAG